MLRFVKVGTRFERHFYPKHTVSFELGPVSLVPRVPNIQSCAKRDTFLRLLVSQTPGFLRIGTFLIFQACPKCSVSCQEGHPLRINQLKSSKKRAASSVIHQKVDHQKKRPPRFRGGCLYQSFYLPFFFAFFSRYMALSAFFIDSVTPCQSWTSLVPMLAESSKGYLPD